MNTVYICVRPTNHICVVNNVATVTVYTPGHPTLNLIHMLYVPTVTVILKKVTYLSDPDTVKPL